MRFRRKARPNVLSSLIPVRRFVTTLALAGAVVSLATSPPPSESAIGHPSPAGLAAMSGAVTEADQPLWPWFLTQGGLTTVCLVFVAVLYIELRAIRGERARLIELVEKNTAAVPVSGRIEDGRSRDRDAGAPSSVESGSHQGVEPELGQSDAH